MSGYRLPTYSDRATKKWACAHCSGSAYLKVYTNCGKRLWGPPNRILSGGTLRAAHPPDSPPLSGQSRNPAPRVAGGRGARGFHSMQRRIGLSRLNINRSREPERTLSPWRRPLEASIGNAHDERIECGKIRSMRVKCLASPARHGCRRMKRGERAVRGLWPARPAEWFGAAVACVWVLAGKPLSGSRGGRIYSLRFPLSLDGGHHWRVGDCSLFRCCRGCGTE